MLKYLSSQIFQHFLSQGSSPYSRVLRYALVILAAVWLSAASYYYFNDDCSRSNAAFISGIISFMLAMLTLAWDLYAKQRQLKTHPVVKLAMENSTLLLSIYNGLRPLLQRKGLLKSVMIAAPVVAVIYFMVNSKDQKNQLQLFDSKKA